MNASKAPLEALQRALDSVFAAWVRELDLRLVQAHEGEVRLALPVAPRHVHGGGVLCGQTMMAAADTAMVLAVMTHLGEFKPMTTVQMSTSFMRPIPAPPAGSSAEAMVIARVLRMGRQLVFGEIVVQDSAGPTARLAAHATTTYALL